MDAELNSHLDEYSFTWTSIYWCHLNDNSNGRYKAPSKYNKQPFCIALYYAQLICRCPGWHALTRDHTVLPAIHMFIHELNEESYLPLLPSCRVSLQFGQYRIFRTISRDFFFKNFRVAAYIAVRFMYRRFQKTTTQLHTARCGVPQSALDHDQLTHSTPQSLTVSAAV